MAVHVKNILRSVSYYLHILCKLVLHFHICLLLHFQYNYYIGNMKGYRGFGELLVFLGNSEVCKQTSFMCFICWN